MAEWKGGEMVLAEFECPSCHTFVKVTGVFGLRTNRRVKDNELGIKVVMKGVKVEHDCTEKTKEPDDGES